MNNIILTGRLTQDDTDCVKRYKDASGKEAYLYSSSLAVRRNKDVTDFIPFIAFSNNASYLIDNAKKGSRVLLQGDLQQEKYTDRSGNERQGHRVHVMRVEVIDYAEKQQAPIITDNDLPF